MNSSVDLNFVPNASVYRLAPQQLRACLTTTHGLTPAHASYGRIELVLPDELDLDKLKRACQDLTDRHESLRTEYLIPQGHKLPYQHIQDSERSESGSAVKLSLYEREGRRWLRMEVASLSCDAASLRLLAEELLGLSERQDEEALAYADVSEWLLGLTSTAEAKEAMGYWRSVNVDGTDAPVLPWANRAILPGAMHQHRVSVGAERASRLSAWALSRRIELRDVYLALFVGLCSSFSGRSEWVVGLEHDGRSDAALGKVIGMLARVVPMNAVIEGESSWSGLAARLGATRAEAGRWAEYFDWAQLKPGADSFLLPLQFAFEDLCGAALQPDAALGPRVHWQGEPADLRLRIERGDSDSTICIEYATGKLDAIAAEHFAVTLLAAVDQLLSEPNARIGDLPILLARTAEVSFQHAAVDAPLPISSEYLTEALAHWAKLRPDSIALTDGEQAWSYATLQRRAFAAAESLQAAGIEAGDRVAIVAPRSLLQLAACHAVWAAGACFVPIEPDTPTERLNALLTDSGARLALTGVDAIHDLPCASIALDTLFCAEVHAGFAPVPASAHAVAYLVYTSGTSGLPKAVMVSHGAIANYVAAIGEVLVPHLQTDKHAVFASLASVAADLGYTAYFGALATGSGVRILSESLGRDPRQLADFLRNHPIDVLKIVPSHLRVLLAELDVRAARHLLPSQILVLGGERTDPAMLKRIAEVAPELRILNHYGPTETCVGVLTAELFPQRCIVVGKPLHGVRTAILDAALRPVFPGFSGQLFVSGEQVAHGYLGRAAQTAVSFLPDPANTMVGARRYATGDLVRQHPDGNIEFIGRIDDQVKIRGYRIEPAEIEVCLRQLPDVAAAACKVVEIDGRMQLAAFVCVAEDRFDAASLRAQMLRRLPDYMVPALWRRLDSMPLNDNGKIDRRRLPDPSREGGERATFEAPRNDLERKLGEIISSLLNVSKLSIHDNFFELGGDSIIAIQIAARARRQGLRFSADQLFAHPTLALLAQVVSADHPGAAEQGIVEGESTLTPIQQRFFQNYPTGKTLYNHGRVFVPTMDLDEVALRLLTATLMNHHDALRSTFRQSELGWRQHYATQIDPATVPLWIVDTPSALDDMALSRWRDEQLALAQNSIDPVAGPVLRVLWIRDAVPTRTRLLFAVHHLVIDVVSWNVLVEDIVTGYLQAMQGAIELPDKTSSFRSWAERLTAHATSDVVLAEAPFWSEMLAGSELPLPVDRACPDADNTIDASRVADLRLDAAHFAQLFARHAAARTNAMADVLLCALSWALTRWAGTSSVSIELEGHGREELFPELDVVRTVGWFTARYPLRFDFSDVDTLLGALPATRQVRARVLRRGIGYGLLRFGPQSPQRSVLCAQAPPRISFNYVGQVREQTAEGESWLIPGGQPGAERDSKQTREHLLTFNAVIVDGTLELRCQYSGAHFDAATVQRLLDSTRRNLLELAGEGMDAGDVVRAADVPLAQFLNDNALSEWISRHAPAPHHAIRQIYPLSPLQHGMLFHTLAAPHSGAYMLQLSVELGGAPDIAALHRAWQWISARHPVLRTGFGGLHSDKPLQFVVDAIELPYQELDWRDLDVDAFRTRLDTFLREDREQDFELACAPLMRVATIRQPDGNVRMVWTRHHAIIDGWSSSIVLGEFVAAYAAMRAGTLPEFVDRPPYERYIQWLQQRASSEGEASYWREYLQGAQLPTPILEDGEGRSPMGLLSDELHRDVDVATSRALREQARAAKTTFNILAQAAWAIVLGRASDLDDVVFGAVVSGRPESLEDVERMVGPFINTQLVRVRAVQSLTQTLADMHVAQQQRDRFGHTPPAEVRRLAGLSGDNELFQSLLLFQNYAIEDNGAGSKDSPIELVSSQSLDKTNYPLTLYVSPQDALKLRLSCDPKRVDPARAQALLDSYVQVLELIAREARLPDANDALPIDAWRTPSREVTKWLVAGTFNVEPLAAPLKFWAQQFGQRMDLEFSPHAQLLQTLFDPRHRGRNTVQAPLLACVRWQDWLGDGERGRQEQNLAETFEQLLSSLEAYAAQSSAPILMALCSSLPAFEAQWCVKFDELNARLRKAAGTLPQLCIWTLSDSFARWGVVQADDARSDAIAHTPYTQSAYAALASDAFRRHHALTRAPYKVLVLDCDNTLWGGVCGEVGVAGVAIDGGYSKLREFALSQKRCGVLLAIASKNNEADVRAVFAERDLGLRFEDFAAFRIDWKAKSANITDIARELNLGLESFVFLDDDPVQCLEVATHLPGALVLQIPDDPDQIGHFVEHLWALDADNAPAPQSDRTELYAQNRQREHIRGSASSLGEFIASLGVEIDIDEINASHWPRVADLAQRTNQFNLSLQRHTEATLHAKSETSGLNGFVVRVRDRFGDYGVVGASCHDLVGNTLSVNDLWLSCRALGRGVEYTMLRALASSAIAAGADWLWLRFEEGPRNAPAREFLASVAARLGQNFGADGIRVPASAALELQAPTADAPQASCDDNKPAKGVAPSQRPVGAYALAATQLHSADAVLAAIAAQALTAVIKRPPYVEPRSDSERLIAGLISDLLSVEDVGGDDNFFALGGHSLLAVRLVARLSDATGVELPLHVALESPRVADLALRLDVLRASNSVAANSDEVVDVMEI